MKALYRIVNALLAAAVFPIILLMEFIYFRISTTVVEAGLHETLTAIDLIELIKGDHVYSFIFDGIRNKGFSWPEAFDIINGRLITTGVCFVLVVIAALFIIIWSVCSNKRIPILIGSAVGLISTITMTACFSSAASVITTGVIGVRDVLSNGLLTQILGSLIKIEEISFAGFQNGLIFTFIFLLIWTGSFYIIEIGEPKEEKTKKAKK